MLEYSDEDYAQDNLRDVEPASYSSETPHFDGLFARYDVGNGYAPSPEPSAKMLPRSYGANT